MAEPQPSEAPLEGFLFKKGEKALIGDPKWKRRWFKQDKSKLLYYKKGSKQPAGFIDLSDVTKVTKSSGTGPLGALNGFKLVTPTREWELQAESDRDVLYWMDGLVRGIALFTARPTSPRPDGGARTQSPMPDRALSPTPAQKQASTRAVSPVPAQKQVSSRALSPSPKNRPSSPPSQRLAPSPNPPPASLPVLDSPIPDALKTLLNAMPPLPSLPKPLGAAPATAYAPAQWHPRCTAPDARRSALPGIDLSASLSLTATAPDLSANITTSPRQRAPMPSVTRPLMQSVSTRPTSPLPQSAGPAASASASGDDGIMTSLMKESIAVTEAMWHGTVDLMKAPLMPFLPADSVKPPERSVLDENPESPLCQAISEDATASSKTELQRLFELSPDSELVESYYCGYYTGNFYQRGVFYIFSCHICYNGRYALSGSSTTEKICYKDIVAIERKNTVVVLPNGIEIEVKSGKKYFFGGFLRVSAVFDNIERLWKDHSALLAHPVANKPAKEKLNQLKFQERFGLGTHATLITQVSCAFYRIVYHVGQLYISKGHICFRAKAASLAGEIKEVIPFSEVVAVERRNSAIVIPNAIEIITRHTSYFFSSFLKRDQTVDLITNLWRQHAIEGLSTNPAMQRIRPAGPTAGQQTQAEMRKEVLVSKGSAHDQELFRRATRDEPGQLLLYGTKCTLTKGNVKQPTAGTVFVTLENLYFLPDAPANAPAEKIPMKEVVAMERRPHSGIKTITTVTRFLMIHFADREAAYDEFVKAWNRKRSAARLFGATLQAVLAKEPPGTSVPGVLQRAITVLTERGVREDGVFRAVPPQAEVSELRQKMEEAVGGADVDMSRYGVHVVATALKCFLKDLPEPLLGYQDPSLPAVPGTVPEKLAARLKTLPKENRAFLRELGKLLSAIARDNPSMPSAKLALVFAPLLYPPRDPNDLAQIAFAQEVVRAYVDNALTLFPKLQRGRSMATLQRVLAAQPELILSALTADPRSLLRLAATCRQLRALVMPNMRLWRDVCVRCHVRRPGSGHEAGVWFVTPDTELSAAEALRWIKEDFLGAGQAE